MGAAEGDRGGATRPPVRVEVADPADGAVSGLFGGYVAELDRRFARGYRADQLTPADALRPPSGVVLVALVGEVAAGCGALRVLNGARGEVKHLFVARGFRGLGLGRLLLGALEAEAERRGCRKLVLDTSGVLDEAIALYRSSGYLEVASYNENPHAELWFEKPLGAKDAGEEEAGS